MGSCNGEEVMESSTPVRLQVLTAAVDFMGGTLGGVASVYIGQPLDTVKVKMQTFPHMYKNAWDCFKHTLTQEGVKRGLYAGTGPSLAAQVSENAVLFMAYGCCQKVMLQFSHHHDVKDLSLLQNATAGGLAAFWSSLVLCPTELIKCRLQALEEVRASGINKGTLVRGPWQLTKQIVRQDGPYGLFRGLQATLVREMPGYFFFFGGYETSRYLLSAPGQSQDDIGAVRTMASGGVGGMSFWISVFPADVIKSRVQVLKQENFRQMGFFNMMMDIIRNEGWLALYKGLGPTLLRTVPATGGLFLAYESTKTVLMNQLNPSPVIQ